MGESILVDFSGKILDKLISLAAQEMVLVWGFKKDLADFEESFEMIQAVLKDAEQKQVDNAAVKLWLEKLKEVSARADDVLDEILYETLRQNVQSDGQKKGALCCCIPSSYPIAFRLQMAHKIKDINARLAKIKQQAVDFNLQKETADARQAIQELMSTLETDSEPEEFPVIGRENDAESLVKMITGSSQSSDQRLSVIPVVAMGGLGKTTLAKMIYHDENVTKCFNVRVWIYVSNTFDVKALLTQILKSVTKKTHVPENRQDIIQSLQEEFEGKKYLIVLDDIWNEEENLWDDFRSCMLKVNKGSGNSILLTTRSDKAASISKTIAEPYVLKGLSDEECWSIIKGRAFSARDSSEAQDQEPIGIEIAKRCGGVPLAAMVIGGMLRSKVNKQEWLSIQKSGVWNLEGGDRVLHILKLSFDNLPDRNLKQCFAYCSIFRKGEVVEREKLIQLWMALGFLQADEAREKDIEDVGDDFFKILVQRCLFQDVVKDDYGDITSCKMHDLVHDLALSLSKTEIYNSEVSTSFSTVPKVRHLADYSDEEGASMGFKVSGENARHLHTLYTRQVDMKLLLKFRGLRILILNNEKIEEVHETIGELKHLRYLDLSECKIRVLPKSIGKLYHLQTLKLEYCFFLNEFPTEIRNLVNLRYLHTDVSFNPRLFPGLRNLPLFKVDREQGRLIGELGCLKDIRGKLMICGLEEVSSKEEAEGADLARKRKLYQLGLEWKDDREGSNLNDKEVLENLQCPPDLKVLNIQGFLGDNFPEWVLRMALNFGGKTMALHNLVDVKFWGCKRCEHIPMLWQLPVLQRLELGGMDNLTFIDASFFGRDHKSKSSSAGGGRPVAAFRSLKSFIMSNMPNLETWLDVEEEVVVFPSLEELILSECHKIKLLPNEALRGSRQSLKLLKIICCSELETIPSLQGFTSLQELIIEGCWELTSMESGLLESCTSLSEMEVDNCPNLMLLPELRDQTRSLKTLRIRNCNSLEMIPTCQGCTCLRELYIELCEGLESLPDDMTDFCASLLILEISDCPNLMSLPKWHGLSSLNRLRISHCTSLETIPSLQGFTSLEELMIWECSGLTSLPGDLFDSCTSLKRIQIRGCNSLETFPTLQGCVFLEELRISECSGLKCLPSDLLHSCPSLQLLHIDDCYELRSLPKLHNNNINVEGCSVNTDFPDDHLQGEKKLTCLERLTLGPFAGGVLNSYSTELQVFFQSLKHSLRELSLSGREDWESIPESVQHLTSLVEIEIYGFGIEALPDWFGNLSNLGAINIMDCSKLKRLPSIEAMQRLTKLYWLNVMGCPLLEEMAADRTSTEFAKIAVIPPSCEVEIDGHDPRWIPEDSDVRQGSSKCKRAFHGSR